MPSHIVYDGVPHVAADGKDDTINHEAPATLFAGQKLWFAHRVPARPWLMENAELNGAVIVKIDKDADVMIVDHARKDNPPGTYSYKYVEHSIRNDRLEDLSAHAVGTLSRVSRPVGSTSTAPRQTRVPFTAKDDQDLWDWIKPYEDRGGTWKGNEIYKQLESVNPRHTFQSWRDRWIKHTRFQNRQISSLAAADRSALDAPAAETLPSPHQAGGRIQGGSNAATHNANVPYQSQSTKAAKERDQVTVSGQDPPRLSEKPASKRSRGQTPPPKRRRVDTAEDEEHNHPVEVDSDPDLDWLSELPQSRNNPFSIEEMKQLHRHARKLASLSSNDFNKVWTELASSEGWTGHTPTEWNAFYGGILVPEYCRRNKLTIREFAPHLAEEQERAGPSKTSPSHKDGPQTTRGTSEHDVCTCHQCHTTETKRWCEDSRGRTLCHACAVFLRTSGVSRPSTTPLQVAKIHESRRDITNQPLFNTDDGDMEPTLTRVSNYVHRGTSPIASKWNDDLCGGRSPTELRSQSPVRRRESPSLTRLPEPNEARKRSTARGSQSQSTSQESSNTDLQSQAALKDNTRENSPSDTNGLINGPEHPSIGLVDQGMGWKELLPRFPTTDKQNMYKQHDERANRFSPRRSPRRSNSITQWEPAALETVHLVEDSNSPSVLPNLKPAPNKQNRPGYSSPLFASQDESDEEIQGSMEPSQTGHTGEPSNPIDSESFEFATRKPSSRPGSTNSSIRPLPHKGIRQRGKHAKLETFDTAPETMEEFESAPETQSRFQGSSKGKERRMSTQALFDQAGDQNDLLLDLALPEPDGGWNQALGQEGDDFNDPQDADLCKEQVRKDKSKAKREIEPRARSISSIPLSRAAQQESQDLEDTHHDNGGPQLSFWLETQMEKYRTIHPNTLKPILFKVLGATSLAFGLASEVVAMMMVHLPAKYHTRQRYFQDMEIEIPKNMKGVWTSEDDYLLLSKDTADVDVVLVKHGRESCDARFNFLGEWVEG